MPHGGGLGLARREQPDLLRIHHRDERTHLRGGSRLAADVDHRPRGGDAESGVRDVGALHLGETGVDGAAQRLEIVDLQRVVPGQRGEFCEYRGHAVHHQEVCVAVRDIGRQQIVAQLDFGAGDRTAQRRQGRADILGVCDPFDGIGEFHRRAVGVGAADQQERQRDDEATEHLEFDGRKRAEPRLGAVPRRARQEQYTDAQGQEAAGGVERHGRQQPVGDDVGRVPQVTEQRCGPDERGAARGPACNALQVCVRPGGEGGAEGRQR